jgi:hypothetical protein
LPQSGIAIHANLVARIGISLARNAAWSPAKSAIVANPTFASA